MTVEEQFGLERIDGKLIYSAFQSNHFLKKLNSCIRGTEKRRRERGFTGYKVAGNPQILMSPIIEATSSRMPYDDYFHSGPGVYDVFFLHTHHSSENGIPSPGDIGWLSLAQACKAKEKTGVRPIGIVASYVNPPYISLALHQVKKGMNPVSVCAEAKELADASQKDVIDEDKYVSLLSRLNLGGVFFDPRTGAFDKMAIHNFDLGNQQEDKLETVLEKFSFEVRHQKRSHD